MTVDLTSEDAVTMDDDRLIHVGHIAIFAESADEIAKESFYDWLVEASDWWMEEDEFERSKQAFKSDEVDLEDAKEKASNFITNGAVKKADWVPYQGPEGGEGWQNTENGNIVYDDQPPGDTDIDPNQYHDASAEDLISAIEDVTGEDLGDDWEQMSADEIREAIQEMADPDQIADVMEELGSDDGEDESDEDGEDESDEDEAEVETDVSVDELEAGDQVVIEHDYVAVDSPIEGEVSAVSGMITIETPDGSKERIPTSKVENVDREVEDVDVDDAPEDMSEPAQRFWADDSDRELNNMLEAGISREDKIRALESHGYESQTEVTNRLERAVESQKYESETIDDEVSLSGDSVSDSFYEHLEERGGEGAVETGKDVGRAWASDPGAFGTLPLWKLAEEISGSDNGMPQRSEEDSDEISDEIVEQMEEYREAHVEILREMYGDEIKLFRGFKGGNLGDDAKEAMEEGGELEIDHYGAGSWTTNPGIAIGFGRSEKGFVVKDSVPVEEVVTSSHLDTLMDAESEMVAARGEQTYDEDDVDLHEDLKDDVDRTIELFEEAIA